MVTQGKHRGRLQKRTGPWNKKNLPWELHKWGSWSVGQADRMISLALGSGFLLLALAYTDLPSRGWSWGVALMKFFSPLGIQVEGKWMYELLEGSGQIKVYMCDRNHPHWRGKTIYIFCSCLAGLRTSLAHGLTLIETSQENLWLPANSRWEQKRNEISLLKM